MEVQARRLKKEALNSSRTRASKLTAQAVYTQGSEEECEEGEGDYVDSLAEEAEEAAYHGNMKELYMATKKMVSRYSKPERPAKDKPGQAITDWEQQLQRWAENFKELLNRPSPENPLNITEAHTKLN